MTTSRKRRLGMKRRSHFPSARWLGNLADPSTSEPDSILKDIIAKLEEGDHIRLAYRLGELNSAADVPVDEASVSQFVNVLLASKWPEPTNVGLNDEGEVTATWVNRAGTEKEDENSFAGSAALNVPSDGKLYEITAMFGVQEPGREWVQVVGKINYKMALGLMDSLLMGRLNELRATSV